MNRRGLFAWVAGLAAGLLMWARPRKKVLAGKLVSVQGLLRYTLNDGTIVRAVPTVAEHVRAEDLERHSIIIPPHPGLSYREISSIDAEIYFDSLLARVRPVYPHRGPVRRVYARPVIYTWDAAALRELGDWYRG